MDKLKLKLIRLLAASLSRRYYTVDRKRNLGVLITSAQDGDRLSSELGFNHGG